MLTRYPVTRIPMGGMSGTRKSHFLLLLAVALMACPVSAYPPCELAIHQDDDSCHARNDLGSLLAELGGGEAPTTDDCCPTGCQDCGLPCCTGIAMILASAPTVGTFAGMRVQPLPFTSDLPRVDPDTFFHPPRF